MITEKNETPQAGILLKGSHYQLAGTPGILAKEWQCHIYRTLFAFQWHLQHGLPAEGESHGRFSDLLYRLLSPNVRY